MSAHPADIGRLGDAQQRAKERWNAEVETTICRLEDLLHRLDGVAWDVAFRDASPALFARLCGDASELLCQLEAQAKGPTLPDGEYR